MSASLFLLLEPPWHSYSKLLNWIIAVPGSTNSKVEPSLKSNSTMTLFFPADAKEIKVPSKKTFTEPDKK